MAHQQLRGTKLPAHIFTPRTASSNALVGGSRNPLDMRVVADNFGAITGTKPKFAEVSRFQQPYDWHNLLSRYEGQALELQSEYYTAEMLNERGAPFLAIVAPILMMVDKAIEIHNREFYMLPYDMTAIGGVPRKTFWRKEVRQQRLAHYLRYQSLEINFLMDPNYGREALQEILGVLVAQARLTLYVQAVIAVVAAALERSHQIFANSARYALMLHNQTNYFALGNISPDDFTMRIITDRDPFYPINLIILPEGQGRSIYQIFNERASVKGTHYGYDPVTERLVAATYDAMDAAATMSTVEGPLNFIEAPSFRYSAQQDSEPTQALRCYSTGCEVVLMPVNKPSEDYRKEHLNRYDPVTYDQTETRIQHSPISYADALGACGIWNDPDTGKIHPHTEFSSTLMNVIKSYNESSEKASIRAYYMNTDGASRRDNNTPLLSNAEIFRRYVCTATVDRDNNIHKPVFIMTMSEQSIPSPWIEKFGRFVYAEFTAFGRRGDLRSFMYRYLPDGGNMAWLAPHVGYDGRDRYGLWPGEQVVVPLHYSTLWKSSTPVAELIERFNSPASAVQHIEANKIALDGTMEQSLFHVPDSHIQTFLELGHRAVTEAEQAKDDPDRLTAVEKGVRQFTSALKDTSGKTSSRVVLDGVHSAVIGKNKSFADLPAKLLSTRDASAAKKLEENQLTMATLLRQTFGDRDTHGTRVGGGGGDEVDAMDIDGDLGAKSSPAFGAPTYPHTTADNLILYFPILAQRLQKFQEDPFYRDNRLMQDIFTLIGCAFFSYQNMHCLADRWGIHLFRFNYWRPFQRYRMMNAIGMQHGPQTMITAFSSPIVYPSMQGMEGYINIMAQFFSAAIVREPKNFVCYPNVFCGGLRSDINVQFVRTVAEFRSMNSHKPSVLAEIVPLDETTLNFPTHMLNEEVAPDRDANYGNPLSRHSGADLLAQMGGRSYLERMDAKALENDVFEPVNMSLVGHRSWSLEFDIQTKRYNSIPGTGFRPHANQNEASVAAKVWAGMSSKFTNVPEFTVPVA